MGSQQTIKPSGNVNIPSNYPKIPTSGKLEILWDSNNKSFYHRLSPYSNYTTGLLTWGDQPFYYIYADENKKFPNVAKKYESRQFPIGSAPIDVIRVSKFLVSGAGVNFLAKQFLLQTGNPYNETRIYNPISPIIAAGMGLALGSIRPMRSLDISGLGGILRSLIGDSIPNAIFGEPKISKPSGTSPDSLIGGPLDGVGGKGLIRAGDANRARSRLEKSWPQNSTGMSINRSFGSIVKNLAGSLFANIIPQTQQGISQRSDEGAYGLMIGGGDARFGYFGPNRILYPFGQLWVAGGSSVKVDVGMGLPPVGNNGLMRKNDEYPSKAYRLFIQYSKNGMLNYVLTSPSDLSSGNIPLVGDVGYTVQENGSPNKPGFRYGDSVGENVNDEPYANSDVMFQYKQYAEDNQAFPTKNPEIRKEKSINDRLRRVLTDIKNSSDGIYKVNVPVNASVIRGGDPSVVYDYNRLFNTNKKNSSPLQYPLGVLQDYRNVQVVDETLVGQGQKSYHLPINGKFDSINTLTVLPKKSVDSPSEWGKLGLVGWGTEQWKPYEDDLISFYLYDVVNQNFIPFRSSIKGISENGNASWEDFAFIGRGDRIYSYGGFTRNLNLNLHIVISSIAELAPTWQRINYLTTLIKPANYTTDSPLNQITNRFMIPPMFMLTIGDLYRDQPILIQTITTTIPDDASWETLNNDNNNGNVDWTYLSTYISSPNILFAQLPREVEISLNLILLEKERAVVGGANFGHAPRLDDGKSPNNSAIPNGGSPNKFHNSLVVDVYKTNVNTSTPPASKTPAQQPIPTPSPKIETPPDPNPIPVQNPLGPPPVSPVTNINAPPAATFTIGPFT